MTPAVSGGYRLRTIRLHLGAAQGAEQLMRQGASGAIRDAGTDAYVQALDAIFTELAALEGVGLLELLAEAADVFEGGAA